MTKDDTDFDTWFDIVQMRVGELTGIQFMDRASVREDFDDGLDCFTVAESIADEFTDISGE